MSSAKTGVLIGAVLALTWILLGFWQFLFVALSMVSGAIVGRVMDGKPSLSSVADAFRGKRTSS